MSPKIHPPLFKSLHCVCVATSFSGFLYPFTALGIFRTGFLYPPFEKSVGKTPAENAKNPTKKMIQNSRMYFTCVFPMKFVGLKKKKIYCEKKTLDDLTSEKKTV